MSHAIRFSALASLAVIAGCTDQPSLTAPTRPNAAIITNPAPTTYTVTVDPVVTLAGFPGSDFTAALGINTLGEVAGTSKLGGIHHAVRWAAGSSSPSDVALGIAHDINTAGQLVGEVGVRAALWTPNGAGGYTLTNIGDQLPSAITSTANGINGNGQVVGTYHVAVSEGVWADKCFLWTPVKPNASVGTVTTLPDLGGSFCVANDINSTGSVVGASTNAEGESHAFVWGSSGWGRLNKIRDLTPGAGPSYATAINDAGVVAGQNTTETAGNAAIWTPVSGSYVITNLGTLDGNQSWAMDINDAGFVVGFARHTGVFEDDAFFWQNGEFTILPGTASVTTAYALTNVNGNSVQVVGSSYDPATTARTALRWDVTLGSPGTAAK